MLRNFAFNLLDDGLVGQQLFAGEATHWPYMTDRPIPKAVTPSLPSPTEPVSALFLTRPFAKAVVAEQKPDEWDTTVTTKQAKLDSPAVSRPLHWLTEQIIGRHAAWRIFAATADQPAPRCNPSDLTRRRILLTGVVGISAAATKQFGLHRRRHVDRAVRICWMVADGSPGDSGTAMSLPPTSRTWKRSTRWSKTSAHRQDRHPDQQCRPVDPAAAGQSLERPARRRAHHGCNFCPARHIRGLAPGLLERGDPAISSICTWAWCQRLRRFVLKVYNASKAALSAVERIIETEWEQSGRAFDDAVLPAGGSSDDCADERLRAAGAGAAERRVDTVTTPARTRPVRIASGCRRRQRWTASVPAGSMLMQRRNEQLRRERLYHRPCCRHARDRHRAMEILASRIHFGPADISSR